MQQANATVLLSVHDVKVAYGGIQAVKGVSLEVREGELVSLIGSNGAGKTTTMKAITGLLPLGGGHIELAGQTIAGLGVGYLGLRWISRPKPAQITVRVPDAHPSTPHGRMT